MGLQRIKSTCAIAKSVRILKTSAAICAATLWVAACGGGSDTPSAEPGTQAVSGTAQGLTSNTSALAQAGMTSSDLRLILVESWPEGDMRDFTKTTLSSAGSSFKLSLKMNKGSTYAVRVETQPAGQYCTVSNGTGTVTEQAITNVAVNCVIASHDVATQGVPKFVASNYIDLSQTSNGSPLVNAISLFRSSEGHSYEDGVETCRSMKHYFKNPDANTKIYAPINGIVTKNEVENTFGTQLWITSKDYPAITFKLFHVNLNKAYATGATVSAGEQLGTHIGTSTWSDVAVQVITSPTISKASQRYVSYFETLTDAAFLPFKNRGIANPQALILTQAQRDANPLTCSGETFTNAGSDPLAKSASF